MHGGGESGDTSGVSRLKTWTRTRLSLAAIAVRSVKPLPSCSKVAPLSKRRIEFCRQIFRDKRLLEEFNTFIKNAYNK